ncbi:TonB-dependent receptor [Marivirga harenae]|uniref:TonB-dependent receptor n=1 Tax=Marivirga harenae TaxID=2010992 RepID=UPI0026DF8B10|nr:TonB-dependent receptor [Marivirga harenae]WKV10727.1 TonB-dependent receptor [Marivirga harenae]|tara:strand:+ start:104095 stop:106482 length:2388 start_codon:yes stop_codon:yes gene_type:complete
MKRYIFGLIGTAIFFLIGNQQILAQGTASFGGYVRDAKTEEPLIGATVIIEGTELGAVTNLEGYYEIKNIEPQSYTVTASYVGYEKGSKFNVTVRSGGIPNVNFELSEDVEQLEGVTVRANPFKKNEETPLSIQKLSPEEIATYPGGNNDIAKVAQSLPGVSGSVGGFRNDIIIRGGAPNENVYYLDGIEIPNINHFSTQGSAGGPVGLLNVSFFEGVTLSSSAFASQYDNVLSGVLQFDQRDGNRREFRNNFRLSSSEAAVTTEGPLFKKKDEESSNTSFIASVRRSYLQLLFQAIDLPFLPDYWDYQYKVTHKFDDYNELIFTGVGSLDDLTINAPDDFDAEQQAVLDQIPVIQQWSTTSGLSWKRRFKDNSGFMTTALSTNILNNQFDQYEDNVNQEGLVFSNKSQEQEVKLRYNLTKFVEDWTFSSGFIVQEAIYSNNSELVDENRGFSYENSLNFTRYGLNAQASRNFVSDRLGLSAGFRVDGNTFTETGNEIYRTFSPRFSASYTFDEKRKWTLNASVGRYFKIPPYTILGFTDQNDSYANQDAEYIQSDHLVAGIEYLVTPSSRFSIEGFYKKYDNYPVSVVDSVSLANLGGGFSVLGNENIESVGLGRTYGMEFLYQRKLTKDFYAILAYTLYRSEFTGFNEDEYLRSTWDNRNLLTFTGGYKFGNNWELSARVRYLGRTPVAPVDQAATLNSYPNIIRDYSRQGDLLLDPFNQTDIRIDKKWNFDNWTFNVFLELQNAFVQDLPSEPSFGLRRNDAGEIQQPRELVRIADVSNSSLLPNLGIVIDF